MVSKFSHSLIFWLSLRFFSHNFLAAALRNVTVNDNDDRISYVGQWDSATDESVSYMRSRHYTTTPGSSAVFAFTGVAIYYIAPLFANLTLGMSTLISLDGGDPEWVDLSSATDEPHAVRWAKTGLTNGHHTILVSVGLSLSGQWGTRGEVYAFIYTEAGGLPIASIPISASLSLLPSPTSFQPVPAPTSSHVSLSSSSRSLSAPTRSSILPPFPGPLSSSASIAFPSSSQSSASLSPPSSASSPSSFLPTGSSISSSLPVPSSSSSSGIARPSASVLYPPEFSPPFSRSSPPSTVFDTSTVTSTPSFSLPSVFAPNTLFLSSADSNQISLDVSPAVSTETLVSTVTITVEPLRSDSPRSRSRLSTPQKGGITAGSLVGGALLVTAAYIMSPIAASLLGFYIWKYRRIHIVSDDLNLPELQISLFLTIGKASTTEAETHSKHSSSNQHLVWKAFSVGGHTQDFEVTIPVTTGRSKQAGQPKIGFGTLDDDDYDKHIHPQFWQSAPARLLEDGNWEHLSEEQEGQFIAENTSGRNQRIAMGVSEHLDDPEEESFAPFLVIDSKNFQAHGKFIAKSDIYIHAFRTGGCREGDYGDTVIKTRKRDRLTPEGGYRIKDLDTVTTFYVSCSRDNGEVKLTIGKNRPEDVKRFRLEHGNMFGFRRKGKGKNRGGGKTTLLA